MRKLRLNISNSTDTEHSLKQALANYRASEISRYFACSNFRAVIYRLILCVMTHIGSLLIFYQTDRIRSGRKLTAKIIGQYILQCSLARDSSLFRGIPDSKP